MPKRMTSRPVPVPEEDIAWKPTHFKDSAVDPSVPQPPAPRDAARVVRLRFQGYSAIAIPSHPEIGIWEPGYYRTVPEELAAVLRWNHRPREGDEPDFVVVDPGAEDLPPNVGTRKDDAISRAEWEQSRA